MKNRVISANTAEKLALSFSPQKARKAEWKLPESNGRTLGNTERFYSNKAYVDQEKATLKQQEPSDLVHWEDLEGAGGEGGGRGDRDGEHM